MNIFVSIINFLYRIRWWVLLGSTAATLWVMYITKNMAKYYEVSTTVYTGVVSGIDIQSVGTSSSLSQTGANNAMDNLLNILVSKATLNRVALRLFAQHMMYGDPNENNKYIQAASFRALYQTVPQDVKELIDKSSEEITLKNLYAYQDKSYDNYVYGLFNWNHQYYSYEQLKTINVRRVGSSDMIDILYQSSDPGVAYNTLLLLTEEFSSQYSHLRYGETDNVIKYFEDELERARRLLTEAEDSLTLYNMEKRVINYDEQSKHVAALSRDFELNYETILLKYESTKTQIELLGERIDEYTKRAKSSESFLNSSAEISTINTQIVQLELFGAKTPGDIVKLKNLKTELERKEKEFLDYSKMFGATQYTREGIANSAFIEQWLQATIEYEKAIAELKVMKQRREELDDKYTFYSPVGTTIKRKEREIDFTENTYLSILQSLNTARLRKKNLQLTGASLQVINPPIYPLISKPTKRMFIVVGTFFGSVFFIIGLFILLEILDRTLRDKRRAENITKLRVIGALPEPSKFKYRMFNKQCDEIAERYLANVILSFDKVSNRLIINLCSINEDKKKEELAQKLYTRWTQEDLNVKMAVCGDDFFDTSKEYMFAKDINDLIDMTGYDIIIIVLPALSKSSIPLPIFSGASLNLITAPANTVWQEADQLLVDNFVSKVPAVPFVLCLTSAGRMAVEAFTGLLPPYTRMRKFVYNLLQLGFTSK